jgi:hypothetical protein
MNEFYQLDLPLLNDSLHKKLVNLSAAIAVSQEKRKWLQDFCAGNFTVAYQEYGTELTQIDSDTHNDLNMIFSAYFPGEQIQYVLGKIESVPNTVSVVPPHCDRGRFTACNFVLETGGENVETVFYDFERDTNDLNSAVNFKENDVKVESSVVFKSNCWYVFNAQQAHGVTNITGSRYLLSLLFDSNIKYHDFVVRYKHLLRGCG